MERHPGDSRDLSKHAFGPHTEAPVVRVRDVLLITTTGGSEVEVDVEEFIAHPPAGDPPVDLGRDLAVAGLGDGESELVMDACSPRGHFFIPIRQYGMRNALVREISLEAYEENNYNWDTERVLHDALALSRLVRDNASSTEYAARIVDHEDGEQQVIYYQGFESGLAYRLGKERDWLDAEDAVALRDLLSAYWARREQLPPNVARALWRAEDCARERWLDNRLPGVVTGLEALVNTNKRQVTKQFTVRVAALADELEIAGVGRRLARRLYNARSQAYHGRRIALLSATQDPERQKRQSPPEPDVEKTVREIALLEQVLRQAVRRCILDEDFAKHFRDAGTVRRRWPVPDGQGEPL